MQLALWLYAYSFCGELTIKQSHPNFFSKHINDTSQKTHLNLIDLKL